MVAEKVSFSVDDAHVEPDQRNPPLRTQFKDSEINRLESTIVAIVNPIRIKTKFVSIGAPDQMESVFFCSL